MTSSDTTHLSIGEVLSLLQEEFPDVTISKIRFLESQGLLDPERTPSGYRKFYETDVERLRWILQQQRDHFLPLKVIKDRLDPNAPDDPDEAIPARDTGLDDVVDATSDAEPEVIEDDPVVETDVPLAVVERAAEEAAPRREPASNPMDAGPTDLSLTAEELASSTGLTSDEIEALERYGLLASRQVGADILFGRDAIVVARAAAAFRAFGVEPRHLRMYKVASEREAGFFEQVVMPMLKQRNPEARRRAVESVAELATLGQQLHAALLRQALDDSLG